MRVATFARELLGAALARELGVAATLACELPGAVLARVHVTVTNHWAFESLDF